MKELIRKILREEENEPKYTGKNTVALDLKPIDAWSEFRKQNAERTKKVLDQYKWDLLIQGLEIEEEEFEEPQVIKDLNTMIEAIKAGKNDRQLIRSKEFKNLNLDKDKLVFWREHLEKPEIESIWVRTKDKVKQWIQNMDKEDSVAVNENQLKTQIKKILREQIKEEEYDFLCLPFAGADTARITGDIGDPRDGGKRKHGGIDILTPNGTILVAPADGKVTTAKWREKGGKCGSKIMIEHDGLFISPITNKEVKLKTAYCHLIEIDASVTKGATVTKGQVIGKTGGGNIDNKKAPGAGNSSTAHLHYEIYENSNCCKSGKRAVYVEGGGKYDYVPCKATEIEIEEPGDDDLISLLIWLNRGEAGTEEESRSTEELIELLPDCYKKLDKDRQEDGMAIYNLWQWGYIDGAEEKVDPFDLTNPVNIKALLDYQKKYGLQVLPVDIVNGCRIPQETLDHINANDAEVIVNE